MTEEYIKELVIEKSAHLESFCKRGAGFTHVEAHKISGDAYWMATIYLSEPFRIIIEGQGRKIVHETTLHVGSITSRVIDYREKQRYIQETARAIYYHGCEEDLEEFVKKHNLKEHL